ncbi:glycosyltransferase [Candidatus Woesebacteria bacterium]|nr:glycosyltransferase [Candidatus Woesebacteria bacterium]
MNTKQDRPTIAIVYDHLTTTYGGAEVVLQSLHDLYPDAPLYTTVYEKSRLDWIKLWSIKTSFLQHLPSFFRRRHQWQALIAPLAIETLDVSGFDIVISVSAGVAKGIVTNPRQLHVCYLLTPIRYLYESDVYTAHAFLRLPGIRWISERVFSYLRWWDRAAAFRPDRILAISNLIAQRVKKYYGREVDAVIYPPFRLRENADKATDGLSTINIGTFDLIISRLVWYKRVDTAILASRTKGSTLVIVGSGVDNHKLHKLAGKAGLIKATSETLAAFLARAALSNATILFCGALSNSEAALLLSQCRSLLMLGEEDYGMTAIEALAAGKPVVLSASSGAAELLTDQKHCLALKEVTPDSVLQALTTMETRAFPQALLKRKALRYSDSVFQQYFAAEINRMWQQQKERYDDNS